MYKFFVEGSAIAPNTPTQLRSHPTQPLSYATGHPILKSDTGRPQANDFYISRFLYLL